MNVYIVEVAKRMAERGVEVDVFTRHTSRAPPQVVDCADRLVANTAEEARELASLYDADPGQVATVAPGADLSRFTPQDGARRRLRLRTDAVILLFVGRIQPLKAPDVLIHAAAR